jgi:hypothetical protein
MSAAYSLRDDPLQAQLTGFDEHERSLGHQDVAAFDPGQDIADRWRKDRSSRLAGAISAARGAPHWRIR